MTKLKKDGTPKRSGGARIGAGKPKKNPLDILTPVSFSITQKYLLHFGGKDAFIEFMKMYAEQKFNQAHGIKQPTEREILEKSVV